MLTLIVILLILFLFIPPVRGRVTPVAPFGGVIGALIFILLVVVLLEFVL